MTAPLLPPPAETILMYAAWGWAFEQGDIRRSGRPRLPERHLWVPIFDALIKTPAGMGRLKQLAVAGFGAWSLSASTRASLDDAFHDPRINGLLTASLQDLARTTAPPIELQDHVVPKQSSVKSLDLHGPLTTPKPITSRVPLAKQRARFDPR